MCVCVFVSVLTSVCVCVCCALRCVCVCVCVCVLPCGVCVRGMLHVAAGHVCVYVCACMCMCREHAASCYYEGCMLAPGNTDFELAFKRAIEEAKREYQAAQAAKATQRET